MTDVFVLFVTGLTTGGLSCLAVQGELLATSIAHQTETESQQELAAQRAAKAARPRARPPSTTTASQTPASNHTIKPILIFSGTKLVVYTILGAMLGALGSVLQLRPTPYIRKVAKNSSDDVIALAFLGALTVFIPCGVTQSIMPLAITSGDPLTGALIMFSFTLGSSPLFFALAYAASKLGERMEARFLKFAAVLVLVLGLVAVDSGLNLIGSPLSFTGIGEALLASSNHSVAIADRSADADNIMTISVHPDSYAPNRFTAVASKPAKLKLVTSRTAGAAQSQPTGMLQSEPAPNVGGPGFSGPILPTQVALVQAAFQSDSNAQVVTINVSDYGYEPPVTCVKANMPIKLVLQTQGAYN